MKKLLITGGTGFIGRSILRHIKLVKSTNGFLPYDQITVISRSPESFRLIYPSLADQSWLKWHKGNILIPSTLPKNISYDYILHAASDSTNKSKFTPIQTYRQIIEGTENMLKFASRCNAQRFLLTSSGGAYGPQPNELYSIPETFNGMPDPLNPLNAYGVAKRQAEHLCTLYGYKFGFHTVIARCFAFVGIDLPRNYHFAIGNFIRDAIERQEITVNGNGRAIRSYMHQSDLAHWLLTILINGTSGNAYNVGSDQPVSISELAHMVRDILSPEKQVHIKNNFLADNAFRNRYIPNITKAKKELGLEVNISLKKSIELSGI